jgi:hypothetical protein
MPVIAHEDPLAKEFLKGRRPAEVLAEVAVMEEYVSPSMFLQEAERLVEQAERKGVLLRVMGAVAVRMHCQKYANLHSRLRRLGASEFTDIDFMTVSESAEKLATLLGKEGYVRQPQGVGMAVQGFGRQTYRSSKFGIDVFVDRLVMCHTINLRRRLKLDRPTIPLADLLLEKIQIVEINLKDIKDVIVLFREHGVGDSGYDTIDSDYIAKLLSKDWGFYYTSVRNLKKIRDNFVSTFSTLSAADKADVEAKIDRLIATIANETKSFQWKARAKLGTKIRWYRDTSEIV